MLLAVVLLYVGAVLGVNGIWLVGQARAAAEPVAARAGGAAEPIPAGAAAVGGADPGAAPAKRNPLLLEGREVAVINIFTGFVGVGERGCKRQRYQRGTEQGLVHGGLQRTLKIFDVQW